MIISLIGFMGCGKSSIGKVLSDSISCPFVDLDAYIESKEGRKIPDIFSQDGETAFRKLELDSLKEIIGAHENSRIMVLALGGGTVTVPECAGLLKDNTFCVYLRARTDTLVENLQGSEQGRPMLSGNAPLEEKISRLMNEREYLYEQTASSILDTDDLSYNESAMAIAAIAGLI